MRNLGRKKRGIIDLTRGGGKGGLIETHEEHADLFALKYRQAFQFGAAQRYLVHACIAEPGSADRKPYHLLKPAVNRLGFARWQ